MFNSQSLLLTVVSENMCEEIHPVLPINFTRKFHSISFTHHRSFSDRASSATKEIFAIRILLNFMVKFAGDPLVVFFEKIKNGDLLRWKILGFLWLSIYPYTRVKTKLAKKVLSESNRISQVLVRELRFKDAIPAQNSDQCQKMDRISCDAN